MRYRELLIHNRKLPPVSVSRGVRRSSCIQAAHVSKRLNNPSWLLIPSLTPLRYGYAGQAVGAWIWRNLMVTCLLLVGLIFSLGGCSDRQSGVFHFEVLTPHENELRQEFSQACYTNSDDAQVTIVLRSRQAIQSKVQTRHVTQHLIIKTFWRPQRGFTPVTVSATNANLEYLIELDSETAWYRGAGFVQVKPNQSPRDQQIHLRSATLELHHHTTGFPVTFLKANVVGQARAIYDPEFVNDLLAEFGEKCRIASSE